MMASQLARAKLARAAHRLNEGQSGALPPLILMTDDARVADPLAAAKELPRGSAVILRHRNRQERARQAVALACVARAHGLALLIAGDEALARAVGAGGVHFSEREVARAAHCRALNPGWLITVAAHSDRALSRAARAGADAALLAPAFPTKSHPDKKALGALRVRIMAATIPLAVYALGGISARNVERLYGARLAGLAAIEGLLPD